MPARRDWRLRTRQSLSVRLFVLVVSVILLVEGLIFIPGLQHERTRWLQERFRDAQIVMLATDTAQASPAQAEMRGRLQGLANAEMIRTLLRDRTAILIKPLPPTATEPAIDLDQETWTNSFLRALGGLVLPSNRRLEVVGTSPLGTRLDLVVPQAPLARFLRRYTLRYATISAAVALITGTLMFIALNQILVVPLRRIARSIAAFRDDPERAAPLDAERISPLSEDEITMVGRELSAMQAELRTALWRNARLAAVGTAVAKMSHDLRGVLSSALLVADRLTMSQDDKTRQAGDVIVRAVHRATALAQHTLVFVREGPPPLARVRANLRSLIDEAATAEAACTITNAVEPGLQVNVDHDSMLRVLSNLFRNAAQAGANRIEIASAGDDTAPVLTIADNGPGLPEDVQSRLFRPFVASRSGGSGLGLAIARDLMRAHCGDLELTQTGPTGTTFTLYLQQPRREEE
jgi:signal transduction histidine kinase